MSGLHIIKVTMSDTRITAVGADDKRASIARDDTQGDQWNAAASAFVERHCSESKFFKRADTGPGLGVYFVIEE